MTDHQDAFAKYLNQPCDAKGCDRIATHNQNFGKFCNTHTDFTQNHRARDD